MSNLMSLRLAAREIFNEALRAVFPEDAVRRAVQLNGPLLEIGNLRFDVGDRPVYSVAIGKAALPMALALEDQLGQRLAAGIIAGPVASQLQGRVIATMLLKLYERWRWYEGGHPLPTKASLAAAEATFALLERANEEAALVIFLVSGGGSAMIEWPVAEAITLADLSVANQVLVNCGATISEINAVRRACSAIKGGKLAARAPACDQVTLIVSDVPLGEEAAVASGPTLFPPRDAPVAREVIARYGLRPRLPETIIRAIETANEAPESKGSKVREHLVLLNNHTALEAAAAGARRRGFVAEIAMEISDQPIADGCGELLNRLTSLRADHDDTPRAVCLISGGEFACPVRGDGIGGRNLETALRLASAAQFDMVALCAGTDGIDGASPAAGALIDRTTMDRARSIGIDATDFLQRSDSYSFFVALGDAITTGPTGTNVRDVRILLAEPQ